jgi:hypothetical protein
MKPRTEKMLSDIFGKDASLKKLSFLYEKMVDEGRISSFGDYRKGNLYILKSIASGQEFNETQRHLQIEWDRIRDERTIRLKKLIESFELQLQTGKFLYSFALSFVLFARLSAYFY